MPLMTVVIGVLLVASLLLAIMTPVVWVFYVLRGGETLLASGFLVPLGAYALLAISFRLAGAGSD